MIPEITLDRFVDQYLQADGADLRIEASSGANALNQVVKSRDREAALRGKLPSQLVRRLDAGFARSCTVHPDVGQALYSICFLSGTQDVFETGTYWGFSTAYLAAALQDRNAGKVYTFDIYKHAGSHIPKELLSHVEIIKGKPSVEAMPDVLAKITPGVFFQDSLHDYEGVRQELEVVAPSLVTGAIVLFHDFVVPGVQQAAVEVLEGYDIYVLKTLDPQQLGVAVKK